MDKIVTLQTERPGPRRSLGVPRSGARILFFTGVRYSRDSAGILPGTGPDEREACDTAHLAAQDLALDLAAH